MTSREMASRKRKEAEKTTVGSTSAPPDVGGTSGQLLLAGYLANEFLTRGTLMGRQWDAAKAAVAEPPAPARKPLVKREADGADRAKPAGVGSYAEVARLVKTDQVHIPGIVNPTQLARWVQM